MAKRLVDSLLNEDEQSGIIQRVLNKAYAETESWNDDLGVQLAYFCHAVVNDDKVDWSDSERVLSLFREWFPLEDPVWKFIEVGR